MSVLRALVVASMATRDPALVAELSAECDTVIAADGGGRACLLAGVIPDLVVGDLDSLGAEDRHALEREGVRFSISPAAKDVTDLDLALTEVRGFHASTDREPDDPSGGMEVVVTGIFGGRVDHSIASIGTLWRFADIRPRVREPDLSAWVLSSSARDRLELFGVGSLVSLFALGGPATVTCGGCAYLLGDDVLDPLDSRGLSNLIVSEPALVRVSAGSLLVISVPTNGISLARDVFP